MPYYIDMVLQEDDRMEIMSTTQAAEALGVRRATLAVWRWRGKGPRWQKLSGGRSSAVIYLKADVEEWLARKTSR
jgi:predicted DNA-binding transcriptional regulator AlpA